jgi:hypothetical protein
VGTILGVVIGYVLGTRAGDQGWEELVQAWKVISTSEEVRDLLMGSLSVGRDLVGRAAGSLAGGGNNGRPQMRAVA